MKYEWILKWSIWSINGTLTGATGLGQSRPGRNGNEGILSTPQISQPGVSLLDTL